VIVREARSAARTRSAAPHSLLPLAVPTTSVRGRAPRLQPVGEHAGGGIILTMNKSLPVMRNSRSHIPLAPLSCTVACRLDDQASQLSSTLLEVFAGNDSFIAMEEATIGARRRARLVRPATCSTTVEVACLLLIARAAPSVLPHRVRRTGSPSPWTRESPGGITPTLSASSGARSWP
jgi:hypothetical protein